MQYVQMPGTDKMVSVIGLGTWVFGADNWGGAKEEESLAAIGEAVRLGMTFMDTAPFYGDGLSETLMGRVIGPLRDKVFVATKCGLVRRNGRVAVDLSPDSIRREVELSLRRLQCDVIDLYQTHWPDSSTPVEKTMETLLSLQTQKKIRHIGVCNVDVPLLRKALAVAPVHTVQVAYSLLDRVIETGLLPFCREQGIGVITYGSLGGGILTGKYTAPPNFGKWDARKMFYRFYEKKMFEAVQKGLETLGSVGRPLNQVVLNWTRQQPGIMTVLAGCRTPQQVQDNAAAADWTLTPDELARIGGIRW